ncbi:MAG: MFS transporter [Chloroflexota bacterium]|jgi:MFS family permease
MHTRKLYLYGQHDWALILTCLIYIQTAIVFSAIGVAWIDLLKVLSISYTLLGIISVIGAGLSMVSMMIGGSLVSHFGARRTMIASAPILFLSHVALALFPNTLTLVFVNVGWGIGFGALIVACTAVVIDWERERRKRVIDPFQASWNIASIVGALLGGWLLSNGWDFKQIMWLAVGTSVPLWFMLVCSAIPGSGIIEESGNPLESLRVLRLDRSLTVLAGVIIVITFAQNVGVTWSPIYLDTLGADPFISGVALASFQGATAVFRLINGVLVRFFGDKIVLWSGALGVITAGAMLFASRDQYIVLAAFILLGAAVAGAQPTAISLGVRLLPTRTALVSAGILAVGEVGFVLSTPILGWVSDLISLQYSLSLALPCGLVALLLVFGIPNTPKPTS